MDISYSSKEKKKLEPAFVNKNGIKMLSKAKLSKAHIGSAIMKTLVWASLGITLGILAFVVLYILANGLPYITLELFSWEWNVNNQSMLPSMINTLVIALLSLGISLPIGIGAAIYMVEYARKGNKFIELVRITTETLSGIPSIVYGLFGYLLFVINLGMGYSMIAGILTISMMILPIIIRTTEEALLSVPVSYREASFGLGAGKLRTISKIILPDALPGILSGVSLAIGRILGETAALIFTAGTVANIPDNIGGSASTMAVHLYVLLDEGLHMDKAYATAVMLILVVLMLNGATKLLVHGLTKKNER